LNVFKHIVHILKELHEFFAYDGHHNQFWRKYFHI
jgi:hypothetical protein